jgi:hypothetical protein
MLYAAWARAAAAVDPYRNRTQLYRHKSRELRRYQHLREELKRKTVDLIAGVLKEAREGGNNASSSRLLHGGKNRPKKNRNRGL